MNDECRTVSMTNGAQASTLTTLTSRSAGARLNYDEEADQRSVVAVAMRVF